MVGLREWLDIAGGAPERGIAPGAQVQDQRWALSLQLVSEADTVGCSYERHEPTLSPGMFALARLCASRLVTVRRALVAHSTRWDGQDWSQLHPAAAPTAREDTQLIFIDRGTALLFGGSRERDAEGHLGMDERRMDAARS